MSPAQARRVAELFEATVDLPPAERSAALSRLRDGEEAVVVEELRSLLAADERENDLGLPLESHAGPYRLVRKLGEGGMSEVFLGVREDGELVRRVAVKLVREELLSPSMIRRFEIERQILASLEHPAIATLLDAGRTSSGRPYFVMELLEGEPIDRFCDARRLPLRARLELFREVCSAVHFAHRNLVVHRDIKPSNVMVTAQGQPKLVDFGIAKLLNPDLMAVGTEMTRRWERLLTPEYASPEQLQGRPVSTASDVYSLGAVLYKLLTGTLPNAGASEGENGAFHGATRPPSWTFRRGRREGSERDSPDSDLEARSAARSGSARGLARELAGDLDAIVNRALRPEEGSRYGSAEQLGEDIDRFLRSEPVLARRGGWRYRLGRLLRRQRLAAGLIVSICALVILAAVLLALQSLRLTEERNRARLERDRAQEVTAFLRRLFEEGNPELGGSRDVTVRQILAAAAARVQEDLAAQPARQADLRMILAETYFGMGSPRAALPLAQQALKTRRELYGEEDLEVAGSLGLLGTLHRRLGDAEASRAAQSRALEIRRRLLGARSLPVARSQTELGLLLDYQQDYQASARLLEETLELLRGLPAVPSADLTDALEALGIAHHGAGNYERARTLFEEAIALRRDNGDHRLAQAGAMALLAGALTELGDYRRAEELLLEHQRVEIETLGPRHSNRPGRLNNLGALAYRQRNLAAAERYFRRGLELGRELLPADHLQLRFLLDGLALSLLDQDRPEEAEPIFREALGLFRASLPAGHREIARLEIRLGSCLAAQGRMAEAETFFTRGLAVLKGGAGFSPASQRRALAGLIAVEEARGQPEAAARYRRELAALEAPS